MKALPEVWDPAGGANPCTGHHHYSTTLLLPNELRHILQGELLLPTVTSPTAQSQNSTGSSRSREGPVPLYPVWKRESTVGCLVRDFS